MAILELKLLCHIFRSCSFFLLFLIVSDSYHFGQTGGGKRRNINSHLSTNLNTNVRANLNTCLTSDTNKVITCEVVFGGESEGEVLPSLTFFKTIINATFICSVSLP